MEYTIVTTSNGPVINTDAKHVVVTDAQDMITIAEENVDFLNQLENHIVTETQAAVAEVLEGFSSNINMTPTKIYAYTNAIQQFLQFKNQIFAQYIYIRDHPPTGDEHGHVA